MKNNAKRNLTIASVVVGLALAVSAVFWSRSSSEPKTVKVGAIVTLTGSGAEIGALTKRGLDLGLEAANQTLQGKKIELLYEDSKTQPADGVTAFKKLVGADGVRLCVAQATVICSAVAPLAEAEKVLMIGSNSTEKGLAKGKNYVIRFYPDAILSVATTSEYIKARYHRVAIFYLQNLYGQQAYTAFKGSFNGPDQTIVFAEPVAPDATDLRTLIAKMLETRPDAIFTPLYGRVSVSLLQQIRERDQKIPIIGDVPLVNPPVYRAIGAAAEAMVLPGTQLDAGVATTDLQKQFVTNYKTRFGENPSITVAIHYDTMQLLAAALRETDGSPEAVRKHILNNKSYSGLVPGLRFDQDSESLMDMVPLQIVQGKLVPISPSPKQ